MPGDSIHLMQSLAWGSFIVASVIRLRRSRPPVLRGLIALLCIGAFVASFLAGARVCETFIAGFVVTFSSVVAFAPTSAVFEKAN
jgi:hypothetical protein